MTEHQLKREVYVWYDSVNDVFRICVCGGSPNQASWANKEDAEKACEVVRKVMSKLPKER